MEVIKTLVANGYKLFNVDGKAPIDRSGKKMTSWQKKSYEELCKEHDYNKLSWGLGLGLQQNGKLILSLDFDVCGKKNALGERVGCPYTQTKLQEWRDQSQTEKGMYSSSTQGNFNVLVDYTNCEKLKNFLKSLIPKAGYENHSLEIFLSGNQVIPPTATICKITGQLGNPRKFLTDDIFYVLTDEDKMTDFIIDLFPKDKKKLAEEKRQLREKELENKRKLREKGAEEKRQTREKEAEEKQELRNRKRQEKERAAEEKRDERNKKREEREEEKLPLDEKLENAEKEFDEEEDTYNKFRNLIFKVIQNKIEDETNTWDRWFHICAIMKSNNFTLDDWLEYSALNPKYDEKTSVDLWRGAGTDFSIWGLIKYAKESKEFEEWSINYANFIQYKHLCNNTEIVNYMATYLKEDIKYDGQNWYCYDGEIWITTDEPMWFVCNIIQGQLKKSLNIIEKYLEMNPKNIEYIDLLKKKHKIVIHDIAEGRCYSSVKKLLMKSLLDKDFRDKLDNLLYKIVFNNGIMDLKTMELRKIQKEDYISRKLTRNWKKIPSQEDINYVREELKKICNYNESHLEFYLASIGYALTGDSGKIQSMWYFRGQTASNGKSLIFEILTEMLDFYCLKQDSSTLDKNGDLRKKMGKWKSAKIVWLDEISASPKDSELIKNICNGTTMEYDKLFSVESIKIPINFKLFCCSENSLETQANNGLDRRFTLCQFNSKFDNFEEDNYEEKEFKKIEGFYKILLEKYGDAILWLLMTEANKFYNTKTLPPYPIEWSKEKTQDCADNDVFKEWFLSNFELDENGHCHKDTFTEYLKQEKSLKDFKLKQIKDNFARLKYNQISYDGYLRLTKEDIGYENAKKQGHWKGFKIIKD